MEPQLLPVVQTIGGSRPAETIFVLLLLVTFAYAAVRSWVNGATGDGPRSWAWWLAALLFLGLTLVILWSLISDVLAVMGLR